MTEPATDRGWGPVVKRFVLSGLTLGLYARRTRDPVDGLTTLRLLFLSIVQAGVLVGVVMLFLVDGTGSPDALIALPILLGVGGVAGAMWARRRDLTGSDARDLARSYNSNFFVGFALAEAPLMVSSGLALWRSELWPYLVCLPFFLIGMAVIAPGRRNLEAQQRRVRAAGGDLSLTSALISENPTR